VDTLEVILRQPNAPSDDSMNASSRDLSSIVQGIESAFADVRLGEGVSLGEAYALDDYASDESFIRYRAQFDDRTLWKSTNEDVIANSPHAFIFMDDLGRRFYLPAFMIWSAKNWHTADLIVPDSTVSELGRSGRLFNREQLLFPWHAKPFFAIIPGLEHAMTSSVTATT
jgi:hypothetical protein